MFQSFPTEKINSLSPMELDVLRYINNNRSEVLTLSIQELAKKIFVSTTTVIRLCKKLDLEGYSHLKYFIKEQLASEKQGDKSSPAMSLEEIINEELSRQSPELSFRYRKSSARNRKIHAAEYPDTFLCQGSDEHRL